MKILESSIDIAVRFSETDAMGVVWHGNYLKFFEDAREKFGEEHDMEYLDVFKKDFYTPIVKSDINHKASLYYGQKMNVKAILEYHQASKIIFKYVVTNLATGQIAATGSTTQVFLGVKDNLLALLKPQFIQEWEEKQDWKEI